MKPLFLVPFLSLIVSQAFASDPSPLQDFCVADNNSQGKHLMMLIYEVKLHINAIVNPKISVLHFELEFKKSELGSESLGSPA
ncbi:hypothetical protein AMTR_s00154p00044230 [Amborella trichopoda]|uniref:Uncharacterized protein n=1 Tax=Amborella trichopoda TaxID=13333 RepID=W1PHR2_AMBTC|nr:hypothetical protein AMTR_s00154p00044230 [Amborella trichopoda]